LIGTDSLRKTCSNGRDGAGAPRARPSSHEAPDARRAAGGTKTTGVNINQRGGDDKRGSKRSRPRYQQIRSENVPNSRKTAKPEVVGLHALVGENRVPKPCRPRTHENGKWRREQAGAPRATSATDHR